MNQKLQNIYDIIQQSEKLDAEQKDKLLKAVKDADKELEITAFKLERTEKVKKTTAILLEETIEELEQKRKAVEEQNRELEIETSLERVRAIALSMKESADMLEVCRKISNELHLLNVKEIRNVQTAIIYESKGTYLNFEYYAKHNKEIITEVDYSIHHLQELFVNQMLNGTGELFTRTLKGGEVKDWYDHQKTTNQFADTYLETANSLSYYWYSLGPVALGMSTYEPLSDEEINLFKRFRNVFELAYRRFLDIEKAFKQAREAEIQLALERVRARSLAMHHTSELQEVVNILAQQLHSMNLDINGGVWIAINDQIDKSLQIWASGGMADYVQKVNVPFLNNPIFIELRDAIKRKKNFFTEERSDKEKIKFFKHLFNYPPWNSLTQQRKDELLSRKGGYTRSVAISNLTSISITNHNGKKFSDDDNEILKRFGNVFEQSYIRFLDLQSAEAQARESEIQLALERVRARTMAMQKSEELSETSFVLFTQLKELGEVAEQISILIYDENNEILELYTTIYGNQWEESGRLPFNENPVHKKIYTTWKEKKKSIVIDISGDELTDFNNFKMKYSNQYKSESELPQNRWILHNAFFSKGAITYSTHEPRPTETITLLERFAAVFDLTYTRFLDLKRAEAQAREAQIEAALERIRSRSLAMQKSEELAETAAVLFQQLHELGYVPDRITIGIIKEDIRSIELWSTDQVGNKITHIFKPSIDETTTWSKIYHQWKAEAKSLVIDLSGIELNEWIRYVREEMNMFINEEVLKENRRVHSVSFFSHGFIMMSTIEAMPVEKIVVLERFSLVFNQTYTRFLDLQKAEAQAREAQIEVALERVRSKTLAMHTSEELADTAAVVFQQLFNLGIEPNRIYIAILKNEKGDAEFWITDEDGSKVSSGFEINLNDNNSFKKMFEGWKGHKKSMIIDMHGEELKEYFNHLTKLNVPFKSGLSQKRRMQYLGYFSKGFIGVASPDETKPETLLLLERFAAVFNLTYTRFNDLLQAEEQNRIIQTENERKTKELEDARRLQISMLPKELPQLPRLDIAVYMKTTTEVGGDYYDFSIDNNGTLTFIVGDATGHGLMSGMMVSIMKSFFISNRNHISLKDFFENANNSIKDMKLGRLMMALMGVQITSDEIIATSAGMPPLIYFRNKSGKAGEFVINNLPLGGMKGINYSLKKIKYEKGDTLLMMSDGFAELKNENHEQYGYTRIKEIFGSIVYKTSAEIVDELKNTAIQWLNGKEPDDDITFVVIKVK